MEWSKIPWQAWAGVATLLVGIVVLAIVEFLDEGEQIKRLLRKMYPGCRLPSSIFLTGIEFHLIEGGFLAFDDMRTRFNAHRKNPTLTQLAIHSWLAQVHSKSWGTWILYAPFGNRPGNVSYWKQNVVEIKNVGGRIGLALYDLVGEELVVWDPAPARRITEVLRIATSYRSVADYKYRYVRDMVVTELLNSKGFAPSSTLKNLREFVEGADRLFKETHAPLPCPLVKAVEA